MKKKILDQISPMIDDLVPYQPGKTIDEVKRTFKLEKVVKLASNECPLPPSKKVCEAIKNYLPDMRLYPEDAAPALKGKLANHLGVNVDQLTLGCGSSEVSELLVRTFAKPGGNLLAFAHGFYLCHVLAKPLSMTVKTIPVTHWQQELEPMLAAIDHETRMLFIINPNNPTGAFIQFDKLQAFITNIAQSLSSPHADSPNSTPSQSI